MVVSPPHLKGAIRGRASIWLPLMLGVLASSVVSVAMGAYVIAQPGMSPIGVSPPLNPVNGAQCEEFAKAASEYQNALSDWHQQCLDANKGCAKGGGQCTCPACEGLHVARDRFTKDSRKEGEACFASVARNRKVIHQAVATVELARFAQDSLLSGLNGVAMSQLRRKVAEVFATESLSASESGALSAAELAKSLRFAQTSARVVSGIEAARAACVKQVPSQAASDCEKQVLLATHDLQRLATANNSVFVRAIQAQVFAAMEQQNRRTLELLNRALNDRAAESDGEGQSLGR